MAELLLDQEAEPSTPASGKSVQFVESTNRRLCSKDDKGVVSTLSMREAVNYLLNSGFWFAQRQAPGTLTTYSNTTGRTYGADRWGVTNENTSVQFIRTDTNAAPETGLQSRFYGTYSKITTTGKIVISQVIEGADSCNLRGRTVRFQLWMKASSAKTMKIAVIQNAAAATIDTIASTFIAAFGAAAVDPTLGTNLAFCAPKSGVTGDNCTAGTNAFSCSVTTAWQRFGGVVDIPSTAKNIIVVVWTDTLFLAADSFSMAQASLTDGYEIQDWAPISYDMELARCQRYYFKTFNVDTLPAASVGVNSGEFKWMNTVGNSAAYAGVGFRMPVRMRVAPTTITKFNPAAAGVEVRNITDTADCTNTAVTADGEWAVWINGTSSAGAVAGEHFGLHMTFDAEI